MFRVELWATAPLVESLAGCVCARCKLSHFSVMSNLHILFQYAAVVRRLWRDAEV